MKKTKDALVDMGIYPSLKGFKYIIRFVELYRESEETPLLKDIYSILTKEFKTKWQSIERDVRHAVNVARMKNCMYNCPWRDNELEYVTVRDFIALMAEFTEA